VGYVTFKFLYILQVVGYTTATYFKYIVAHTIHNTF